MANFDVEIVGKFLTLINRGEVTIVGDSAFIKVEAPDESEARSQVEDWLYDEGLSVGFVDEVKD